MYALSSPRVCVQTVTAGGIGQEKSADSEPNGPVEQEKNHSNSSTLSDRRGSNSSLCSIEEEHRAVYDMVQSILLSTRDNVNFVNEVFHQVRDRVLQSVAYIMSSYVCMFLDMFYLVIDTVSLINIWTLVQGYCLQPHSEMCIRHTS